MSRTRHHTRGEAIDATRTMSIKLNFINSKIFQFVAYSLVAFPIVGIGIIGNLLSLLVLSRPNLKGEEMRKKVEQHEK